VVLPAGSAALLERTGGVGVGKVYEGGLHEVLNGDQRVQMMADMLGFMRSKL